MFNTGDIGRWRTDGQLEHLGRADDQVGQLDHDEHQEQRGDHPLAVFEHHEALAAVAFGHREDAPEKAQHRVFLEVDRFLLAAEKHPDARKDQKRAEDVDDPAVVLDERRAERDHDAAHDERT